MLHAWSSVSCYMTSYIQEKKNSLVLCVFNGLSGMHILKHGTRTLRNIIPSLNFIASITILNYANIF